MVFLGVYRAIYDYQPQGQEELEIRDGDLLFVLEKSTEDDWWKAKKKATTDDEDEPEGLIPNNYIEEATPTGQAKALYDYTQQTDEELSFKEEARLQVYDESDPDWTLVGSQGRYGFAPAIYIEKLPDTASAPAARTLAPPPMPARSQAPIPGEEDYEADPGDAPSPNPMTNPPPPSNNPATALASIIAQRTGGGGGGGDQAPGGQRSLASPPLPSRPQYTPDESEEDAEPPPMPTRPKSQPMSPPPNQYASSPRLQEPQAGRYSPSSRSPYPDEDDAALRSPGHFHLYNVSEMVSHMGRNKKMPTTLGINVAKGIIMISPEKSKDGPGNEWTADKLQHYSIEGKHVFVELVRPSKSVDFHAGAKDTAQEIVAALGELAGASRAEGLREVIAASSGTSGGGQKRGKMLYEFMAQGLDEVTVAADDEVLVLDDTKSEEWWMVQRLKNGKQGVVPSSYVDVIDTFQRPSDGISGLSTARSTVEQNRMEEERLTKQAARKRDSDSAIPERHSSLAGDSNRSSSKNGSKSEKSKSKPNQNKLRTWTDRSGTFKVEAEFIGLREGKIHLHKLNGVKIAVPVSKMAVEDLEYVENATGESLDEDKPLSDIKRRSTQKKKDDTRDQGGAPRASADVPENSYDWFDFFLQCGVNPQICERYAGAFSRDQMGPEVLPDVNEQLLRTLGVKEGDILRIMKHLNAKFGRKTSASGGATTSPPPGGDDDKIEAAPGGGLFSGPGGALRNNTRKGRPAPAVQTNDVVSEDAFKQANGSSSATKDKEGAQATPLTSAPARQPASSGFDDDAWDVKPARTQTPAEAPAPAAPPQPKVNPDIAGLSLSSPALQPDKVPQQNPQPTTSTQEQASQPQGANQDIFDKIASLGPNQTGRQRPQAPQMQQQTGNMGLAPPPRASSAPGFPQQNNFGPPPMQPQLTGYQPQMAPPGQSMQDLQNQQRFQQMQMQQQQTGYPQQPNYSGYQQQPPNGMMPQQTGMQAMQQNYPAMQPQPTGLNFHPQSNFGQASAQQAGYGQQQNYQQQLTNGQQTGSPFADPPRQPFQPTPSGLQNSFSPQQTGFSQQPQFNYQQTGIQNGNFGQPAPQLPPQQTGGVFGPSQPTGFGGAPAPLQPQKTGPAPPVRFGVQPEAKRLVSQPTGRANLAKATPQNPFGF
ncbi:hypothetical protein MBLNU230_g7246t1 [Neophaeotheca triangularis]